MLPNPNCILCAALTLAWVSSRWGKRDTDPGQGWQTPGTGGRPSRGLRSGRARGGAEARVRTSAETLGGDPRRARRPPSRAAPRPGRPPPRAPVPAGPRGPRGDGQTQHTLAARATQGRPPQVPGQAATWGSPAGAAPRTPPSPKRPVRRPVSCSRPSQWRRADGNPEGPRRAAAPPAGSRRPAGPALRSRGSEGRRGAGCVPASSLPLPPVRS